MVYLKYNNVKLPVLDNYNIVKSSQEITFSDLKCDFTGYQKTDLPEKYQEVRVTEELNREIEKIEYEEKKDVKELSFESKVKEKISICKVHGYSSQETREEFKSTVKGTEVTVNDTYINNQTKFNIDGNSYQETTEGYNLLNVPAEYTVLSTENNKEVPISLKANTKYTIKIGSINTDNTDVTKVLFRFRYKKADISNPYAYVKLSDLKLVYTPASDVDAVWIYSSNDYVESSKTNTTYKNLMIYEGTDDKSYEPYTGGIPSPNPDYIQKITSVGEYDNIFDKNNIIDGSYVSDDHGTFINNSTSKRTNYIEIQANSYYHIYSDKPTGNWGAWYDKDKKFISGITLGGKKEVTVNSPANAKYMAFTVSYQGNLTDYSNIKINETAIKIKQSGKNLANIKNIPNNSVITVLNDKITLANNSSGIGYIGTSITLKQLCPNLKINDEVILTFDNTSSSSFNDVIYLDGINEKWNKNTSKTITQAILDSKIILYGGYNETAIISNFMIRLTSTNDTYEPYHEPIITPINLQGNILSKVGNVKDILKINRNGEVEIKKNTWEETINTSDLVTLSNNNKGLVFYTSKKKTTSYSDNDYLVTNAQRNRTFNDGAVYQNPSNFVFVGSPTDTLETIKAKFNGGKILYQLATPQIITLPSISPIELWQGTNIFSLVTNLDTEIELEYNYIPQSPSPEAPSEIKNVKDNINIKIADKNNEEQQEILFPLVQGQKLMQGDYLADDGIHHTKTQIQLDGVTYGLKVRSVTKHSNDIYYCVIEIIKQGINGINNMYCSHLIPYNGVKTGSCYITNYGGFIVLVLTDQSITTVDAANTWLAAQKEKGTPVVIEYELAEEVVEPYTVKQQKAWNNMQNLVSYVGINNINSSTNIDVKYPARIKKEIVPETYDKLLYTGYIDDYVFDEMRELDEDINISFTLLSPQKIATLRTCIAVGTYEMKDLIENTILRPLIDDGFTLKEINIVNKSLTVNFLVETVEYCMNNLSNKYNFWWYIDENKNIYVKDIETMFKEEPMYIYDDKHTIDGLEYVKPITNSYDYANVINFKNVRIYEYSRLRMNKKEVAEAHNPLIDGQVTNIKQNDQITFNFPIDIKKENIIKSANSNGITNTNIIYGIYVEGTYEDNTDFSFFVSFDTLNNLYKISDNLGFDGESTDSEKEFLLMRDSFFSNLITGIKYNNGNKKINSIKAINSDSALIYNVNKFLNDKGILEKKNIISKTGIVERTIDMKESWKTVQELTEIGASYLNKNSLNYADELEIKLDKDKFQVGKTLYINKFMIDGRYVVTEIQRTDQNNDDEFLVKCKNANILDNFIDIFRQENEQTSSDKVYQLYVTHYEEEGISERFEVVQ